MKRRGEWATVPLREIGPLLEGLDPSGLDGVLSALERDPRAGARRLATRARARALAKARELERLHAMRRLETELRLEGYRLVAGVDEAGMAPLAGPVVAAAVILPEGYLLEGLDDSKKIQGPRRRGALADRIRSEAVCWSVGRAEPGEIDALNIYRAGLLAMRRALEGLGIPPDFVLVDARTIPGIRCPQRGIIHGDALSLSIAAASVIAKTTRDSEMEEMDRVYPGYGFASHKGYPTPEHLGALRRLGPLPVHRKSFAPVRAALGGEVVQKSLFRFEGND
ncbi:MAG: ribonuclease HII [Acidobacteria bacterium]|jgi:ribonuclease HII|nr:ribonuclease HII [Acidobacteriota bacterium]